MAIHFQSESLSFALLFVLVYNMLQSGKGSRGHNIGVDIRDILQIHGPMAPIPMRPLLRWQPFLGIRLRLLHGWIPELPRGFHPTPMAVSTQYFRDC